MGNYSIVGEIGEILVETLKRSFAECDDFTPPITDIKLGMPEDDQDNAQNAPRVFVHLSGIEKSVHYGNCDGHDERNANLALELQYVVVAAAKDKSFEHKIAGKAMEAFNENKVLDRKAHAEKPGFSAADQDVKFDFYPLTIEDRHKFWTAYPKIADKTFVSYVARPVIIVGKIPEPTSRRVETREIVVSDIKNIK